MNRKWALFPFIFLGMLQVSSVAAEDFGKFVGVVRAEWIDGRKMKLLEDFGYIDQFGVYWKAPKDSIIDGASIPQSLWSIVGAPFVGKYREASVLHDVSCDQKIRTWQSVHRMFYNASRLGGVGEIKAKLMYAAVRGFGPRWNKTGQPIKLAKATRSKQESELETIRRFIEENNPSLEEIDQLVDR